MRLLLINPRFPESFWTFKFAVERILSGKRYLNPPLGLATLAALCPKDWKVEIVDENIESAPINPEADIIGVCGMGVQFKRQRALLTYYRRKGYYVVAGGSYASLCPEEYEGIADTVVAGESEYIWPEFCEDFERGRQKQRYQETGLVSLQDSPVPRFELLKLSRYSSVSLQFSRGCPFQCEFCDIIVMFGRKPRTKTHDQVGRELDALRKQEVRNAFFVDDNFIRNRKEAKALLRYLIDYQRKHKYWFNFGTEASLNLARDDKLLALFREANFEWVFIGIESPDEESLKETRKYQNMGRDILSSVRHIYSYGIEVLGGFIIGFDNDTMESFERQFRFIMESGIQSAMIGLLVALPKTPLYKRLEAEGRLIRDANEVDNTKDSTNIIPKQMSYEEMVSGYRDLYRRILEHRNIANRIQNKTRYLKNPVYRGNDYSLTDRLTIMRNLFVRGLKPGGFSRIFHFIRTIPLTRPQLLPLVLKEWIVGLSMRDYADRHFVENIEPVCSSVRKYRDIIEKTFQRYLREGVLEISFNPVRNAPDHFSFTMKGWLGRDFFRKAGRHMERVLEDSTVSLTLRIDEFSERQAKHFERLLKRLSQYGDRIHIAVDEKLEDLVVVDSSVFNLIWVGQPAA